MQRLSCGAFSASSLAASRTNDDGKSGPTGEGRVGWVGFNGFECGRRCKTEEWRRRKEWVLVQVRFSVRRLCINIGTTLP